MSLKPIQFAFAGLALLLALTRVVLWLLPPPTAIPPPTHHVLLLLVPDLSWQTLKEEANTPTLKALVELSVVATLKTKPKESPAQAYRRIAGAIPGRIDLLKNREIARVLVGSEESLPLVGADGIIPFAEEWRKADPDTPDGHATDIDRFAEIILSKVRPSENHPSTFLVAIYDDLYRTHLYTPLTMPGVAEEQQEVVLRRLDKLLALLTGPDGLPNDTTLIITAPTGPNNASFTPLLIWRRDDNLTRESVTLAERRALPGVLTARSILPIAFTMLGVPSATFSGKSALLLPSEGGDALQRRIQALTLRHANHYYLRFIFPLLVVIAAVVATLKWSHRPRPAKALAAPLIASPLLLYLIGGLTTNIVGVAYTVVFLGWVVLLLAFYWVPPKRIGTLYRLICLLTLGVFVLDALTGNWIATGSPLTERGGGITPWSGAAWGALLGAMLFCLHPILLRWRWCALITWLIAFLLLFPLGGWPATFICMLFAFGVVVPHEFTKPS